MQISVNTASRSYPVFLDSGSALGLGAYLNEKFKNRRCCLVTNTTLASIYSSYINTLKEETGCVIHTAPDGEKYKTIATWSEILDTLISARLDRSSYIVAFGGGVLGDMAGFAAASFMRGIDYIQVPTTLLSMVDSSVGGKTAVDHPMGKNLIGAFHQPSAVWIDIDFLKKLPSRQFVAGYAEMFKYAFIGGSGMFTFIMNNRDAILRSEPKQLMESIEKSIRVKADIVGRDEKESGSRALLNFGHTFAHALEQFYGFEGLLHGEAVLWGMVCAVDLAKRKGTLPRSCWTAFDRIMDGLPLPALPSVPDAGKVYEAMFADKKVSSGKLRFVLPCAEGESVVVNGARESEVMAALEKIGEL
ncbi:MAG: 3-dehydroquinate synthase [Chitinispirillales bacterium]|jgi:3-dehydroquinate synthase|nr:3-dehydroquinate synthase [Chitinispirillales bacterium]